MKEPLHLLIFTDLDGTLLDHDTYSWKAAAPAMDMCRKLHMPIIMVSSKTRAEMDILRRKMELSDPFVSENGGGIFFPESSADHAPPPDARLEGDLWRWSLGVEYPCLVQALREIRLELGWEIRGFSDMKVDEISALTGLGPDEARLAAEREYDEPFRILRPLNPDLSVLKVAAAQKKLSIVSGGRFFHLMGNCDKGVAVNKLIYWYRGLSGRRILTAALGDSENDIPMLKVSDFPVFVRSRHQAPSPAQGLERIRVTDEPGPMGWNRAVLEILKDNGIPFTHHPRQGREGRTNY